MSDILQLAPQNVWKHFHSLTQIPRPSGHMEKVTEFLVGFGKGLGLETFVDDAGNVETIRNCETVLLPYKMNSIRIKPSEKTGVEFISVYVENK